MVDQELLRKIEANPDAYKKNSPRQSRELLRRWESEIIDDLDDLDALNRFDGIDWYKVDKQNALTRVRHLLSAFAAKKEE